MQTFQVRYVEGGETEELPGMFVGPSRGTYTVKAENRAAAYVKAYHHFIEGGKEVKVISYHATSENEGRPLGFSNEELRFIWESGISIDVDLPKFGVQIEEISVL